MSKQTSAVNLNMGEKVDNCVKCGKYVRHGGIFCTGLCKRWLHLRCINLAYSAVKDLKSEELDNWKCPHCQHESTEEPVNNPTDSVNNDLESSLTLAAEYGNALLNENEVLKQELHNLKNSKTSYELELEDKIMQKEEETKNIIEKFSVKEKQLEERIVCLETRLKSEQVGKAELIQLHEQEKEEHQRDRLKFKNQCKHCKIYSEETTKMLSSIRSLEEACKTLEKENMALQDRMKTKTIVESSCIKCFPPLTAEVSTTGAPPFVSSDKTDNVGYSKVSYKKSGPNRKKGYSAIPGTTKSTFITQNPYKILSQETNDSDTILRRNANTNEVGDEKATNPRMLLCTDSHGRELADYINKYKQPYDAVGFVRPGGRANQVLNPKNIEGENLGTNDFLVISCGTNDVAHNEAHQAIESITDTLERYRERKIVLVDLPNRFDLEEWSCVNVELRKTNAILKNLCERYSNVTIVEASRATRNFHTRHGLHLNRQGKLWLANNICEAAASMVRGSPLNQQHEEPSAIRCEQHILTENIPGPLQVPPPANTQSGNYPTKAQPPVT